MTTVVFDGVTLAADTRSSFHQSGKPHACPHCVGELDVTHGVAEKLIVPKREVKFRQQKVLAWAGAGNYRAMQVMGDALTNGISLDLMHSMLKKAAGQLGCDLIIVTDVSCWKVDSSASVITIKEVTKFPVTLGSGASVAEFACRYLGWTAFGAVGAALHSDRGTGGKIHSYVCRPEGGEPLADSISIHDWSEEELREAVGEIN